MQDFIRICAVHLMILLGFVPSISWFYWDLCSLSRDFIGICAVYLMILLGLVQFYVVILMGFLQFTVYHDFIRICSAYLMILLGFVQFIWWFYWDLCSLSDDFKGICAVYLMILKGFVHAVYHKILMGFVMSISRLCLNLIYAICCCNHIVYPAFFYLQTL